MNPVELPGVAAVVPKAADHAAVVALDDADLVVLAIGAQQVTLFRIRPDRDIPHRAAAERGLLEEPLFDERAVLLEDLDAVVHAVADINQAVIGELDAMHGISELLRNRRLGIVRRLLVVVRRLAIGAPVSLVRAGPGVEHDDAAVAVTVGDIDLVGLLVDGHFGGPPQLRGVVASLARPILPDLHHEFSVEREFHDFAVVGSIACEPDKSSFVDFDAVFVGDPFITFAGSAP